MQSRCFYMHTKGKFMDMTFDEFIQMKGLELKASVSGKGNQVTRLIGDEGMERLGMKNMCFRVDALTQARFEATIDALDISKQEALTEMLWEMLNRIDEQLERIGVGKIGYDQRLRELGYVHGEPDKDGLRQLQRVEPAEKE